MVVLKTPEFEFWGLLLTSRYPGGGGVGFSNIQEKLELITYPEDLE